MQQKCLCLFSKNIVSHKSVHASKYLNKEITEHDLKFDCKNCSLKFVSKDSLDIHSRFHEENFNELFENVKFANDKMKEVGNKSVKILICIQDLNCLRYYDILNIFTIKIPLVDIFECLYYSYTMSAFIVMIPRLPTSL